MLAYSSVVSAINKQKCTLRRLVKRYRRNTQKLNKLDINGDQYVKFLNQFISCYKLHNEIRSETKVLKDLQK